LREITRPFIQDFAATLKEVRSDSGECLSPKYINNITGVLGRILTVAVDREKLSGRPKVDKLPVERVVSDEDALTLDETQRLWEACQGAHGRMIRLLILTGLRAMEVAGLRWEDYDEKAIGGPFLSVRRQYNRYIRKEGDPEFRPPKCDSFRTLPVGPALCEVLNEQKAETRLQDSLIFMTDKGRPFCNELIRKSLHRACRRAGIRRISPHALRRTFVSQTTMATGDLEATAKLAGQKEIKVSREHYLRIEQPHLKYVMGKLEERLFGTPSQVSQQAASAGLTRAAVTAQSPRGGSTNKKPVTS
jgi:integrase